VTGLGRRAAREVLAGQPVAPLVPVAHTGAVVRAERALAVVVDLVVVAQRRSALELLLGVGDPEVVVDDGHSLDGDDVPPAGEQPPLGLDVDRRAVGVDQHIVHLAELLAVGGVDRVAVEGLRSVGLDAHVAPFS
jgi:hypothetical protein